MLQSDALAVPLWIDGRAYLAMAPDFIDVRNPMTGETLRRTPLCGRNEVIRAVESSRCARPGWASLPGAGRTELIVALGEELAAYADHFARLIVEETGRSPAEVETEVSSAADLLRRPLPGDISRVLVLVATAAQPLPDLLKHAVPALSAGATVVVRPSPDTPSALVALAELASRCGFPAGVFNILHCDRPAVDSLRKIDDVNLLFL